MSYQGLYINLDRSAERRRAIEAELARHGLGERYRRLAGIDGNAPGLASPLSNPSEIGCFLSHVAALTEGMKTPQHLHIVEDDALFAATAATTIDRMIASGGIDAYDILYTDIAMPLSNEAYAKFKRLYDQAVRRDAAGGMTSVAFQILDLKDELFLTTSSYIVNKNSFAKLAGLYRDEISAGVRLPIDLFFRNYAKIGGLKIGCLFPFVTAARVEETLTSTVRRKPDATRKFTAANIGRYSFFVDCDWDECDRLIREHIRLPPETDRHAHVLAQLLAFSLIQEFK